MNQDPISPLRDGIARSFNQQTVPVAIQSSSAQQTQKSNNIPSRGTQAPSFFNKVLHAFLQPTNQSQQSMTMNNSVNMPQKKQQNVQSNKITSKVSDFSNFQNNDINNKAIINASDLTAHNYSNTTRVTKTIDISYDVEPLTHVKEKSPGVHGILDTSGSPVLSSDESEDRSPAKVSSPGVETLLASPIKAIVPKSCLIECRACRELHSPQDLRYLSSESSVGSSDTDSPLYILNEGSPDVYPTVLNFVPETPLQPQEDNVLEDTEFGLYTSNESPAGLDCAREFSDSPWLTFAKQLKINEEISHHIRYNSNEVIEALNEMKEEGIDFEENIPTEITCGLNKDNQQTSEISLSPDRTVLDSDTQSQAVEICLSPERQNIMVYSLSESDLSRSVSVEPSPRGIFPSHANNNSNFGTGFTSGSLIVYPSPSEDRNIRRKYSSRNSSTNISEASKKERKLQRNFLASIRADRYSSVLPDNLCTELLANPISPNDELINCDVSDSDREVGDCTNKHVIISPFRLDINGVNSAPLKEWINGKVKTDNLKTKVKLDTSVNDVSVDSIDNLLSVSELRGKSGKSVPLSAELPDTNEQKSNNVKNHHPEKKTCFKMKTTTVTPQKSHIKENYSYSNTTRLGIVATPWQENGREKIQSSLEDFEPTIKQKRYQNNNTELSKIDEMSNWSLSDLLKQAAVRVSKENMNSSNSSCVKIEENESDFNCHKGMSSYHVTLNSDINSVVSIGNTSEEYSMPTIETNNEVSINPAEKVIETFTSLANQFRHVYSNPDVIDPNTKINSDSDKLSSEYIQEESIKMNILSQFINKDCPCETEANRAEAESVLNSVSKTDLETVSENISHDVLETVSENISHDVLETVSENISHDVLETVSGNISHDVLETVSENISYDVEETVSENISYDVEENEDIFQNNNDRTHINLGQITIKNDKDYDISSELHIGASQKPVKSSLSVFQQNNSDNDEIPISEQVSPQVFSNLHSKRGLLSTFPRQISTDTFLRSNLNNNTKISIIAQGSPIISQDEQEVSPYNKHVQSQSEPYLSPNETDLLDSPHRRYSTTSNSVHNPVSLRSIGSDTTPVSHYRSLSRTAQFAVNEAGVPVSYSDVHSSLQDISDILSATTLRQKNSMENLYNSSGSCSPVRKNQE